MVEQPPVHGVAGIDVLGDGELHEVDRRDDRDLARPHIGLVENAAHAAPVIAVGMRVDHGRDGQAIAGMLLEQLPCGAHHFRRHQRIEHDPPALAAHEGDVGEIESAHLIDAGHHLVEPVIVVELRLTNQRSVDAIELVLLI